MSLSIKIQRIGTASVAVAAAAMIAGCSKGLESVPLSSPSITGDTYTVTAQFTNALNLPAQAKVKLRGVDIGQVATITAHDFVASVVMRIRDDVLLPAGSTAELRSATPLGDLFVAIDPGDRRTATTHLVDGSTIPPAATSAGATVEELLSSAALLVNGGVIRNLTTLVNGAGSAVGGKGDELAALVHDTNDLLSRLNARTDQIKSALANTTALAESVAQRQVTLDAVLAAAAPAIATLAQTRDQIVDQTATVARVTKQLSRFPSLQGTDTRGLIAELNQLSAASNAMGTDPTVSLTNINRMIPILLKFTSGTTLHVNLDFTRLAIGSLPDMNYPGDPMTHGPDGTDYHAMIGSLRYEWNLLLDKVYGPRR